MTHTLTKTISTKTTSNSTDTRLGAYSYLGASKILGGTALLMLCSQIQIPLQPVPITLQTVAVLLIGLLFTRQEASLAVLGYLGLRILGIPAIAHTSFGVTCITGPTAGYLLGFLVTVLLMTTVRDRLLPKSHWLHQGALCVLGTLCVFGCGIGWLSYFVGFKQAIAGGFMPFILPGIVKIGILTCGLQLYRTVFKR